MLNAYCISYPYMYEGYIRIHLHIYTRHWTSINIFTFSWIKWEDGKIGPLQITFGPWSSSNDRWNLWLWNRVTQCVGFYIYRFIPASNEIRSTSEFRLPHAEWHTGVVYTALKYRLHFTIGSIYAFHSKITVLMDCE